MAFIGIRLNFFGFIVCRTKRKKKKKQCKGSIGVGYYPFPVLDRNTTVVSRKEGRYAHDKSACGHDRAPARAAARTTAPASATWC